MLFLFSALEALLGDKSGGLKSESLVFYRTHLGQVVSGGFPHPSKLYYLYDKVRSYAVHGEYPPALPVSEVDLLDWSVRDALYEFVTFSKQQNLSSREKVRAALRETGDAQQTFEWIKAHDPWGDWAKWSPWGQGRKDHD